ncbi:hypothetical protein IGS59_14845 [Janthinobacterium sp. GW460P]|uniref:hypothetical protein n=1 Tax=unclassified Janthinobacterium TaxID=2610881 RepID=UPI0014834916|nr:MULTISPECIES: hypothetical protein [unclassified Janthinobacterium]MCC7703524.1 hypothetical protein [Janthinobacterium sp. GW460P]MCC7709031.1 hypothetical protein [Janthinobacterium sp. GW460W]
MRTIEGGSAFSHTGCGGGRKKTPAWFFQTKRKRHPKVALMLDGLSTINKV